MEFSAKLKEDFNNLVKSGQISKNSAREFVKASDEKKKSFLEHLASKGVLEYEPKKPKGEYIPKPIEYDVNNPEELAMGLSQQRDMDYQNAMDLVAISPNVSKAMYKGEEYPLVAGASDALTLFPRGIAGLSALIGGEDPRLRTAQTKAKQTDKPFYTLDGGSEVAENIMLDPFTYTGGGIANLARKSIAKVLPKVGAIGAGALEGLTAGSAEFGLEQERRRETGEDLQGLGDYAMQAGFGTALGGGAGKLKQMSQAKKEIAEAPSILKKEASIPTNEVPDEITINYGVDGGDVLPDKPIDFSKTNPVQAEEKMIQEIQTSTGLSKKQAKSIPNYASSLFVNMTDMDKTQLNDYMTQALYASRHSDATTPKEIVGDMFVKGEEAIKKAKQNAGAKMGEVENQFLSGGGGVFDGAINTQSIKSKWGDLLEEYGGITKEIGEDGKVKYVDSQDKPMVTSAKLAEFIEADEQISKLGDFVTGKYLRALERNLADIPVFATAGRSGKMNNEADLAVHSIIDQTRELVGDQIEAKGGKEARNIYNQAKTDYAKYWTAQDFIQRRLGKIIGDDQIATRGGSMVTAMTGSNRDRNTKTLARMIKDLTGMEIGKHATMAEFAMQSAKDRRAKGGLKKPDLSFNGVLNWLSNRGELGKDLEGMAKMVEKSGSQRGASFLDLIGNNPVAKYGAQGLQNFGQPALRSGARSWESEEQQGLQGLGN